jgi:NAD(P)-dependent dehydrogenase (short-subunit alcohol dehydrogenase family)
MNREDLHARFDLTGRTAIVTGGTRGIGLAIAEGFAAAGASVVVASRKADACAEAERRLRDTGADALGVPTHMGDLAAIASLVNAAVDAFGGIDIIVNNAANALAQPLGAMTPEAWGKSFDTNLRGPVFLVQEALPHLKASGRASVINVISVGAFMFSPNLSIYTAGKAALMAFTRSMAAEYAPHAIRVNALAPGTTDTDMVRNNPPEVQEMMANSSLLKRMAEPQEMVGPALLLASDAGSFMTGQVLIADGGMVPH